MMALYLRRYDIAKHAYPVEFSSISSTIAAKTISLQESILLTDLFFEACMEACGNEYYAGSISLFLECFYAISDKQRRCYAMQFLSRIKNIQPL